MRAHLTPWCPRLRGRCRIDFRHSERHDEKTAKKLHAKNDEDMNGSLPKTFTHHVYKRDKVKVSEAEAKSAEKQYKYNATSVHGGLRRREICRSRSTDATAFTTMIQHAQEVYEVNKVLDALKTVDYSWIDKDIKSQNGSGSVYWNSTASTR